MKFSVAALLLLIAVVFASMDLLFLAFIVVVILAFLAVTDAVPATAGAASGGSAGVAAGAAPSGAAGSGAGSFGTVKRVTITSSSGKTKTRVTDAVDKDELKWAPPGKPSDWGKTGYEEFGSGLAQTVFLPLKVAKRLLGWILR